MKFLTMVNNFKDGDSEAVIPSSDFSKFLPAGFNNELGLLISIGHGPWRMLRFRTRKNAYQ